MPKSMTDPPQVRVKFPPGLYAMLFQESKDTAVTMASLVRIAVKERYARKMAEAQNRAEAATRAAEHIEAAIAE